MTSSNNCRLSLENGLSVARLRAQLESQNPLDGVAQWLIQDVSVKHVPTPSCDAVLSDLITALKRFKEIVRWKAFWHEKEKRKKEENCYYDNDSGREGMGPSL